MNFQIFLVLLGVNYLNFIVVRVEGHLEKTKRNAYIPQEPAAVGDYPQQPNFYPQAYLERYSHIKAISEDPSLVDITYQSLQKTEPYSFPDSARHATNHQIIPAYGSNFNPKVPPQHLLANQYPKFAVYGSEKLIIPARAEQDPYGQVIYGQPNNLQQFKILQPQQHYKIPARIQNHPVLHQQRQRIQGPYYQPQFFDNPVVPQLQHYIPGVRSPFEAFTRSQPIQRPTTTTTTTTTTPPPPPAHRESEEEANNSQENNNYKEEQEASNEEDFDRGYKESARGFPAYHKNRNEGYERYEPRYREEQEEDSSNEDSRAYYSQKRYAYPKENREEYEERYSKSRQEDPRSKKYYYYRKPSDRDDSRHAASSSRPKSREPSRNPYANKKVITSADDLQGRHSSPSQLRKLVHQQSNQVKVISF